MGWHRPEFLACLVLPIRDNSPASNHALSAWHNLHSPWRWFSIWTLGRRFTRDIAVPLDQPVVQNGPYRLIRHPAYSGTFLTMLGLGLVMTNWASLISFLLFYVFLGHFYRVRIEEQMLIQNIGQPYIDYMRCTRRFIPLVF